MRIFIHGVDTFVGKALVAELHRRPESGFNRVFGTVMGSVNEAPKGVRRPMPSISSMGGTPDPKKHKKLVETMQSCKVVIIDLEGCAEDDLLFAITCMNVDPQAEPPKAIGEPIEDDITFILISSVMVWAQTPRPADGILRDKDYETRVPAQGYEKWRQFEDLVLRCFGMEESKVKAYIVAPGVLYGDGELAFGGAFKDAWLGEQKHMVVGSGTNRIPMLHVRDLARLVRQIGLIGVPPPESEETPKCPYFLAVDQPPFIPPAPPAAEQEPDEAQGDASGDGEGDGEGDGADGEEGADAGDAPAEEDADAAAADGGGEGDEAGEGGEGGEGGDGAGAEPEVPVPKTMPSTQAEIMQGIVDELSEHYEVPLQDEEILQRDATLTEQLAQPGFLDAIQLDLWAEPTPLMLAESFADSCNPPGWWSRNGIVANLRKVADEFCKERKLRAMRALIAGPPASGKTELASAVAEHYNIPHINLKAGATDEDLGGMLEQLSSNVCRYRGYVLDVDGASYNEMEKLFGMDKPPEPTEDGEEEEPPPPADDAEEGAEPPAPKPPERVVNKELCPEFVVITQATQELCRARWRNRAAKNGDQSGDMDSFEASMFQYEQDNLAADSYGVAGFFQMFAKQGVLNLPIAGKDEEEMLESTRIYMDGSELGRPFNYLATEEEVAEALLRAKEDRESAAAQEAEDEARRRADDKTAELEETKNQERRLKLIAEFEAEREKLEGLALREYLMRYMVPSLTEGLIEVCKVLPEDPVDYLATYLEEHASHAAYASHVHR